MNYLTAVNDKKRELTDLHTRMDNDRDLVNLDKYVLKDVGNKKIPNAISITLNDPAVFATNVEASLNNASEQVAVESSTRKINVAEIEEFLRMAFSTADSRLIRTGRWPINSYLDQQTCRRGSGVLRILFRIENDELIADITPWDSRYVYYAMGADGLLWAAYETNKSKEQIESETWAKEKGFTITRKNASVLDVWSKDVGEIYVDGKKVFDQKNPYGEVPVCVQRVSLGSMLADKDNLKFEGESIFFLIRDLQPELNRLVSIIQTLNIKAIDDALQYASKQGASATPPDHDDVTATHGITPIDIGGGLIPVPYGELKRSAYLLHQMIESRVQQGSLSKFELGAFTQPMSAIALIEIGQGRDMVFLPRLGARGMLKQQAAEKIISQVLSLGVTKVLLGAKGHQREFSVNKLEGEYSIEYKYFVKSPTLDISRFSMAASAGDLIPESAKRREILQREDPEGDEDMLRWEEAERLNPVVKQYRIIKSLREREEDGDKDAGFEADLMEAQLEATLGAMMSGAVSQAPQPEKDQKPQQLLPIFGGGESSTRKANELQRTPREEIGEE